MVATLLYLVPSSLFWDGKICLEPHIALRVIKSCRFVLKQLILGLHVQLENKLNIYDDIYSYSEECIFVSICSTYSAIALCMYRI